MARDAGANVESVEGFAQAVTLLVQGRVDAIVNDNIAVLDYLASTGSTEVKVTGDAGDEISRQALVFRQSDGALRDQADEALKRLADDGTLADISESYFKADVSVENSGEVDVEGSNKGRSSWDVVTDTAGPMLWGVVKGTIPLTAISFVAGLLIALGVALARMSSVQALQLPARFYISLIRGTPLLVQLFIIFYGLPQIGIELPGFPAACLALSLNVGGYAAEIIRGSILSVPKGQFEAATTIGMGYRQLMRRIVLPQAARIAVPPLSNTLLSLVKDTSLVSVVLVTELFREAQRSAQQTLEFMPLYSLAALYFWVDLLPAVDRPETSSRRSWGGTPYERVRPDRGPGPAQVVRRHPGAPRRRLHGHGGLVHGAARALRLGQDDGAALAERARDPRRGRRPDRRRVGRLPRAAAGQGGPQAGDPELRSRSGMVFQSHNLFPHKTVLENIIEGPVQVQGRPVDEAEDDARALLEQVGLAGREAGVPVPALGRPAAARRHRPRARARAGGGAARRADVRPRPRARRRGAQRDPQTCRSRAGRW